jgi:hypothetical protein
VRVRAIDTVSELYGHTSWMMIPGDHATTEMTGSSEGAASKAKVVRRRGVAYAGAMRRRLLAALPWLAAVTAVVVAVWATSEPSHPLTGLMQFVMAEIAVGVGVAILVLQFAAPSATVRVAMSLAGLWAVGYVGVNVWADMHSGVVPDGQGALIVLAVPVLGCLALLAGCVAGLVAVAARRVLPTGMGQGAGVALIAASPLIAATLWTVDAEGDRWRDTRSEGALPRRCIARYDDLAALREALPDATFNDTSVARECWFGVGMGDVLSDGSLSLRPNGYPGRPPESAPPSGLARGGSSAPVPPAKAIRDW